MGLPDFIPKPPDTMTPPPVTLQSPLALPLNEVPSYMERLWDGEDVSRPEGASTFTLLVWQPAWLEQELGRTGGLRGPVTGIQRPELIEAARQAIQQLGLHHATAPFDPALVEALRREPGALQPDDLRGQLIDGRISELQPRRLISVNPLLDRTAPLESQVAAYCPMPEAGAVNTACGDVLVLRGGVPVIAAQLQRIDPLVTPGLPCWVWWNSAPEDSPEVFDRLALPPRRLIIDTSLGDARGGLTLLGQRIRSGQTIYDLNWYRLRSWRESLAMAFDPPSRRSALERIERIDIDIQGHQFCQGLLLGAWIAAQLGWSLQHSRFDTEGAIHSQFRRPDGATPAMVVSPAPIGMPTPHSGTVVGLRLLTTAAEGPGLCVILCGEAAGCMRLEGGGATQRQLVEHVVPVLDGPLNAEVTRVLSGGHDSTNPLLRMAGCLAAEMLPAS